MMTDVPLLQDRNDFHIGAGIDFFEGGAELSTAYALTDQIGIQASGYIHDDFDEFYTQAAIGHFHTYDNQNIIECYAGYGYGEEGTINFIDEGTLYGNYQLGFLQINVGRANRGFAHADFGISLKSGVLHTEYTNHDYYHITDANNQPISELIQNHFLIEPMAFIRLGGEHLKFSLKAGYCHITNHQYFDYWPVNIGIGLHYSF